MMQFYYISHFIQIWILPPGINLLLGLIGFLILRYSQCVGRTLIAIAFVSLWLLSTPLFSQLLVDSLQDQYPLLQTSKLIKQNGSSIIIVLGGGQEFTPEYENGNIIAKETFNRLHYATYLYKKTHLPIIVSGGRLDKYAYAEADLMLQELKDYFSIPVIAKEDKSITTKDEAEFMVPILQKHKIERAYLVTNAWHIPRAMYLFNVSFKNTHIKIIAAPMGYIKLRRNQGVLNALPSIDGLKTSTIAIHEYIGIASYFLIHSWL